MLSTGPARNYDTWRAGFATRGFKILLRVNILQLTCLYNFSTCPAYLAHISSTSSSMNIKRRLFVAHTFYLLCSPMFSRGFQHPSFFSVCYQKTVMVGKCHMTLHTISTLAVLVQQIRNDTDGFFCCISSFKSEPKIQSKDLCKILLPKFLRTKPNLNMIAIDIHNSIRRMCYQIPRIRVISAKAPKRVLMNTTTVNVQHNCTVWIRLLPFN